MLSSGCSGNRCSDGLAEMSQMAAVAVTRSLFTDILRLIAELRPPPDPATV